MIWIFSILSALAFWAGGRDWGNKLYRRLGCPILAIIALWILGLRSFNLACYIAFFALNFGVLSTYMDFLGTTGTLSNGETYQEETTLTWVICGAAYGLAAIPLYWCGVAWYSILYRIIALTIAIPLIRKLPGAQLQEALSGFVYLATLNIL